MGKLKREYHDLAYFYHWSAEAVENMPRTRREMYWYMVRKQLDFENGKYSGENKNDGDSNSSPKYKESQY